MRPLSWGLMAVVVLAACGERPQSEAARLKKADAKPSTGAVATDKAYMASGWTAGDDTSWQAQIRSRAQSQNEYTRITSAPAPAKAP
jgi:pyruvate/2-oxoglutarate dehydrogenase complex dihydrolipoamide dehydrogenase (E3) component